MLSPVDKLIGTIEISYIIGFVESSNALVLQLTKYIRVSIESVMISVECVRISIESFMIFVECVRISVKFGLSESTV